MSEEKSEEKKETKIEASVDLETHDREKQYKPLSNQTVFNRFGLLVIGILLLCILAYFSK